MPDTALLAALMAATLLVFLGVVSQAAAVGEPNARISGSLADTSGSVFASFDHDFAGALAGTNSDSRTEAATGATAAADLTYTSSDAGADAQGHGSANTGSPPRQATSDSFFSKEFSLTRPMQFSASGSVSVTSTSNQCCVVASARLSRSGSPNVFNVVASTGDGTKSVNSSGVLQPGDYTLALEASPGVGGGAAATPNIAGAAEFDVDFDLADAPIAVTITSAPPAETTATDATFAFEAATSPPPPGHFECRIDSFGFAPCTSPKTFTNIPLGDHVVQVRYVPDSGSAGPPSDARWKVVPSCPDVTIGLVRVKGCFTERQANGAGTGFFETEGDAWIGGFHVRPRSGGKLVVHNDAAAPFVAEGTGVDLVLGGQLVPAPLGELRPFVGDFALSLNTAGTFERFLALPLLKGLSGQVKVTWNVAPGGATGAKLEASVSMEELTKNLGRPLAGRDGTSRSVGTLAGKLGLALENGKPMEVTEGELEIPEYAVEVKGTNPPLKEGFGGGKFKGKQVGATVEWSGEVTLLFPWQGRSGTNQGSVTGRLFYTDFQMAGLGLGVSGFETPIGRTGWDLTGLEGDVLYRPDLSFNVGVKAQQHSSFAGDHLLKLTGNVKALKLAETDCATGKNPVEFVGTFNAPPLEAQKIGELKGQLLMCAYLQGTRNFAFEAGLSGDLTVDVGPFEKLFSATGSAKGWFSGFDFNLDGSYRLTLPRIGTIGADGVLSSEGYAVCGRYGFISAGIATNNWLEPPGDLPVCDFTPFRAVAPARAAGGSARSVRIAPGQSAVGIAVRGGGAAPRVRVTGPNGERFSSRPGDEPLEKPSALIFSIDELKTTSVFLRRPRAGSWRIEPLDGSVPITRIETARQLPEPRIRARVRKQGGKVIVSWRARKVPGQKIELVDRANGVTTTIQRSTSKRRGRVAFRPANPLETRRRIEAVLLQNGSPRPPLTVARYTLRKPKRPARAGKPTARRTAAGLVIGWRKARRARDYLITVQTGTVVLTRTTTRRLKLTYREPPPGRLTVRITPRDKFGRPGPTAVVNVG